MLDEEAPKIYGLTQSIKKLPVYVTEGPLTALSSTIVLALCGSDGDLGSSLGEATRFLFTIMNQVIEKLSIELASVLTEERRSSFSQTELRRKRYKRYGSCWT